MHKYPSYSTTCASPFLRLAVAGETSATIGGHFRPRGTLTGKLAVTAAGSKVDDKPDDKPHQKSQPGFHWKAGHQHQTTGHGRDGNQGNPGNAKGTAAARLGPAQHKNPQRHQQESKQSSNVGKIGEGPDVENTRRDSDKQ